MLAFIFMQVVLSLQGGKRKKTGLWGKAANKVSIIGVPSWLPIEKQITKFSYKFELVFYSVCLTSNVRVSKKLSQHPTSTL